MSVKSGHIIDCTLNVRFQDDPQWRWDYATRGEGFAFNIAYIHAAREAQKFFAQQENVTFYYADLP